MAHSSTVEHWRSQAPWCFPIRRRVSSAARSSQVIRWYERGAVGWVLNNAADPLVLRGHEVPVSATE